jgi:hypothetical protein
MSDTHTATVEATAFMRVILNAGLFASTDDTLPSLTAVHIRPGSEPGTLMLEATNRYVASQEWFDLADLGEYDSDWTRDDHIKHMEAEHGVKRPEGYDGRSLEVVQHEHGIMHDDPTSPHEHSFRPVPETELDVLVAYKDLAKLVKTLKLIIDPDTRYFAGNDRPHVVITHDEAASGQVTFTLVNNNGMDTTVGFKTVIGEFVKIDSLMKDSLKSPEKLEADLARTEADRIANAPAGYNARPKDVPSVWERSYMFNGDYLARMTKVDTTGERRRDLLKFQFVASGKPALVTIGERFRALIMPVRGAG